jgi:hypothetical protein
VNREVSRAAGVCVAAVTVAALGALSRAPYAASRDHGAVVRLAWRARGEEIKQCRRLTAQELERLPAHMRHPEECSISLAPYGLHVALDGVAALDEVVRARGARRDRPLYVFRELAAAPGQHRLQVTFALEQHREDRGHLEKTEHATPPSVVLDTTVSLAPQQAIVVTYDDEQGRFTVLTQ